MAQATQVVKNARATLAETFKLTLGLLHSSPNKNVRPRPATHSTDVIPFTPIDGICFPMITPEIVTTDSIIRVLVVALMTRNHTASATGLKTAF